MSYREPTPDEQELTGWQAIGVYAVVLVIIGTVAAVHWWIWQWLLS